jgi:hypothetical protein
MLPNLVVIGAGRCGTTSLHRYLSLHPQIEMSPRKEPQFFNDWNWGRGLAWYEAHFPAVAKVVGESSPSYTCYPGRPHVPERMASVVPAAKLIYLVRDPIERLVSEYRFWRWVLRRDIGPFEGAVRDFATSPHVTASCYAMQLEQYLPYYPLERILVLELQALAERRAETLRRVFRFLGVDEAFTAPEFEQSYNELGAPRANRAGWKTIGLLDRALGPRLGLHLRTRAPDFLARPLVRRSQVPDVTLPSELRTALVEHFRPDTERLRTYTGEAFADWST